MRHWTAWKNLWRLAACAAACAGVAASEPDFDEEGGSPGNPNPCEETGRSCEPGTLEAKEHDGETEFVVCLGSSISPPDISEMAELAGGTLTVQFDGCPDETSAVSYALETRWVPEIPATFDEPGEFTFAAEAMATSGSSDCSDIPWTPVGEITVTVLKVAIATPPKKICASVESFTINLTEDSYSGDEEIVWGGVEGAGDNSSFSFNPSTLEQGVYTISAGAAGCSDSVKILVTTWPCVSGHEAVLKLIPDITPEQIKNLGGLGNLEVEFAREVDAIKSKIDDLINNMSSAKKQELIDKWSAWPNPMNSFEEWLNDRIEEALQEIISIIDEQINAATASVGQKVNEFSQIMADKISQNLNLDATVKAAYHYQCDSFDPGNPGWSDLELIPLVHDNVFVEVTIGFAVDIALEPAGVGIGSLPIAGHAEIRGSVELDGFHGSPDAWKPTVANPDVSTKVKMNAAYEISAKASAEALVSVGVNLGFGGNIGFPKDGIVVDMNAEDDCDKILPWSP